jgi:hypothetical protein
MTAGANMTQLSTGIAGAIAVSLAFGAVAWGRDLAGTEDSLATSAAVNRDAKADRADAMVGSAVPMRTIALRQDALADTSVMIRVPVGKEPSKEARNGPSAPLLTKSTDRKVACEPVVSVLTEVARRLQPGRCIT